MIKLKTPSTLILISVLVIVSSITPMYCGKSISNNIVLEDTNSEELSDDFYFVQITDPHIMNKIMDSKSNYKNYLKAVIEHFISLEEKPAFFVITGDLVSFGSGILGALNYKTFLECVYEENDHLFADENCTIPVYTIPGNHDCLFSLNLFNYHRLVDSTHWFLKTPIEYLEQRQLNDRFTIQYQDLTMFFLFSGHGYYLEPSKWINIKGSGLSYWFDIEWLDGELKNCSTKHKIILMHHPAVNWGEYDIIGRNTDIFIRMCEGYDVDLVLAGHTHAARVFDKNKTFYQNSMLPLNCSKYPTLHVQTDACKEGGYYRIVTIAGNDIILDACKQV